MSSVWFPSMLLTCGVGGVFVFLSCVLVLRGCRSAPSPPGPRGLPLLGNVFQMPTEREWLKYTEWSKTYGDVMQVSLVGQPVVILSSARAVEELLEKRSSIYSDRPKLVMSGEMIGYVDAVPLHPAGARHREYRKLLHAGLSAHKIYDMHHIHERNALQFAHSLLLSPEMFIKHVRMTVAATVFELSHGYIVKDIDDPLVQLAERSNHEFSEATTPGRYLVDLFPLLRRVPEWVPGASFQATARLYRRTMERVRDEAYAWVQRQVEAGTAQHSFASELVQREATEYEEQLYKWSSTAFYIAGADTSVSAITSFFLAMLLYPAVQRKAQQEMDSILGDASLPNLNDRDRLPYIDACIKEVLRWNPVTPLALPHRLTQDDIYGDYCIKEGTVVIPNTWAILHDAQRYPSPLEFDPDRYFHALVRKDDGVNPDPRAYAFGYGRRVCPGQHLAEATLFMTAATVLALFDIVPYADGPKTVPRYTTGVISHPEPFMCQINPRSPQARILLEQRCS